ncbi:unnamed protein product [Peniophora sp. CBMAI 1063]|nr:unnamed protein product [Peniophora sp. CBMAI 1063]
MRSLFPRCAHTLLLPGLTALALLLPTASAVRIPVTPVPGSGYVHAPRRLAARANSTVGVEVENVSNVEYLGNITLNGETFTVILDTGSADLWVAGSVPNSNDLGKTVSLSYAIGTAKGNVNSAKLTFDDYSVDNQAFVLVTDTSTFSSDFATAAYKGLLGLGPNSGSVIYRKLDADDNGGDSALFRIFEESQATSQFITLYLNRLDSTGKSTNQSEFTISEVIPGFEAVQQQQKLTIKDVPTLTDADQHWAVLSDAWGLTGPDGNFVEIGSTVPRVDDDKLVAVIDSGFTYSQVPRDMSDAIYGRVQGAWYDETQELWRVPCAQELSITFHFGGVDFPIHPLDVSTSDITVTQAGTKYCTGTFQPITTAFSLLGEYDIILGMSFLRNAYVLIDFGDFVDNGKDTSDPFVQMLPTTTNTTAHVEFQSARGNSSPTLLPASQQSHSPETAAEIKAHREQKVLKYWPYILVGCLAFVFISTGLCIWACCMRRKRRRAAAAATAAGLAMPTRQTQSDYVALGEQRGLGVAGQKDAMMSSDSVYAGRPSTSSFRPDQEYGGYGYGKH